MPFALAEIVWERPQSGWLLVFPLALLLLARRPGRAPRVATGTLALWREVAREAVQGTASGKRIPPAIWLACLGLAFGILALSDPRPTEPPPARTWTVVVDRSPSMGLPVPGGAERRLDRAIAMARDSILGAARSTDRVRWLSAGRAELLFAPEDGPGDDWLALPVVPLEEPAWTRFDDVGTLWVSDVVGTERQAAGCVTSGAEVVPGPVLSRGTPAGQEILVWRGGDELEVQLAAGPERYLQVPASGLPPVLERMLTAYAKARGLRRAVAGASPALVFETQAEAAAESFAGSVGRDGWHARVRIADMQSADMQSAGPGLSTWLALATPAGELPVVRFGPGRIVTSALEFGEPAGDPAAFPVSWTRLLDQALFPAPGILSLAERSLAGPSEDEAPGAPPEDPGTIGEPSSPPAAWLASLASVCAALAALVGFNPRRLRR